MLYPEEPESVGPSKQIYHELDIRLELFVLELRYFHRRISSFVPAAIRVLEICELRVQILFLKKCLCQFPSDIMGAGHAFTQRPRPSSSQPRASIP